jgi:hypothetical protein
MLQLEMEARLLLRQEDKNSYIFREEQIGGFSVAPQGSTHGADLDRWMRKRSS